MAGKRLQITVPASVAAKWEVAAEIAGVPLANWIVMMVARDDSASDAHIEMLRRTDAIARTLDELVKVSERRNNGYVRTFGRIESALHSALGKGGEPE